VGSVTFKKVGQGDSIIIEWEENGKGQIGIIDCNLYEGRNAVLEYIEIKGYSSIEFILISHPHIDHYSGMSDLLIKCYNKITIKYFLYTLSPILGEVFMKIFMSMNEQIELQRFIKTIDEVFDCFEETIQVHHKVEEIKLGSDLTLSFIAPNSNVYFKLPKAVSKKRSGRTTTKADLNSLATFAVINNRKNSILLTSDVTIRSYGRLAKHISLPASLVQAPHHGSKGSLSKGFWRDILRIDNCPVVFSVGDEPADKLPNTETVDFFHHNGYDVYSTDSVYGISEFFNIKSAKLNLIQVNAVLDSDSELISTRYNTEATTKYNGDQKFDIL